ncbi:MAG: sigma-70 family RNA polymerase sigma factor [Bacteroidota bacterium]
MQQTDQEILDAIRLGDREKLGGLYEAYRQDFVHFARGYGLGNERAVDIWQDTIIAFYENATGGKITELSSSLKTYLFSIGKYALIDEHRRQRRQASFSPHGQELVEILPDQRFQPSEPDEALDLAISKLGEKCRQLLTYFYYDNFAVDAIANRMGYANENTVSAHKSRCMKKLRDLLTPKTDPHAQ